MNKGKFVFAQLTSLITRYEFDKCVLRYQGDYKVQDFTCWNQFLCMIFGQLTHRESARDIITCLKAHQNKVFHLGIKQIVDHTTLTRANENRSWKIYADFGTYLSGKDNLKFRRVSSYPVNKTAGLRCDQRIKLTGYKTSKLYPETLRRVKYYDAEHQRIIVFLTNNFEVNALTIAMLYKSRWQIELFFKWIKQHLRIKTFWRTSPNAVKTQIWIAVCTYLLIAYAKKQLKSGLTLYEITQILSVSAFDKTPINELLTNFSKNAEIKDIYNQLNLFEL